MNIVEDVVEWGNREQKTARNTEMETSRNQFIWNSVHVYTVWHALPKHYIMSSFWLRATCRARRTGAMLVIIGLTKFVRCFTAFARLDLC